SDGRVAKGCSRAGVGVEEAPMSASSPANPAVPESSEPYNRVAAMALGALGIVYGDIGTSPLYALRECFTGEHGVAPTHQNVLGVLALIFWALIVVVSVKYLVFVMRADNRGEGGILAMMALAMQRKRGEEVKVRPVVIT